jgi:hypothetical protein
MFKVITNYDDVSSTHSFEHLADIFHPHLNPVPAEGITLKQLKNALTVIYSRENILANPRAFIRPRDDYNGGWYRYDDAFIARILELIPDDRLWLLHFVCLYSVNRAKHLTYVSHRIYDPQLYDGYIYWITDHHPSRRTVNAYTDDAFPAELKAIFDEQESYLTSLVDNYGSHIIHRDSGAVSYYNSSLVYLYHGYLSNRAYAIDSTESRSLRRSQVVEMLAADPNIEIMNTGDANDSGVVITLRQRITKTNRRALYKLMQYSASPTAMLPWPLIQKGEHNPLLFGVELELSTDYSVPEIVDAADEPFFLAKTDSSISGDRKGRYEVVTVPMSFKAHKRQWAHWFSNLDYDKFDTGTDTNNGMHVHIGKESFADEKHIKNFVWFFTQPAHIDFMKFFSMRDSHSWENYSAVPPPAPAGRSRTRTFRENERAVQHLRGCVHYSPKGTIEVRLFRGIVSLADIIKNLEFVDSIFHFTMQNSLFTKMSLKGYIGWLHSQHKNKYPIIKKYLERTDKLKRLVDVSELLNLIFSEKNPQKILEIVEKNKFTVTNDHVTALNSRWKKRIFILDKETKKLIINKASTSLSFLDRVLEQRILGKSKVQSVVASPPPTPAPPPEDPPDEFDEIIDSYQEEMIEAEMDAGVPSMANVQIPRPPITRRARTRRVAV